MLASPILTLTGTCTNVVETETSVRLLFTDDRGGRKAYCVHPSQAVYALRELHTSPAVIRPITIGVFQDKVISWILL